MSAVVLIGIAHSEPVDLGLFWHHWWNMGIPWSAQNLGGEGNRQGKGFSQAWEAVPWGLADHSWPLWYRELSPPFARKPEAQRYTWLQLWSQAPLSAEGKVWVQWTYWRLGTLGRAQADRPQAWLTTGLQERRLQVNDGEGVERRPESGRRVLCSEPWALCLPVWGPLGSWFAFCPESQMIAQKPTLYIALSIYIERVELIHTYKLWSLGGNSLEPL